MMVLLGRHPVCSFSPKTRATSIIFIVIKIGTFFKKKFCENARRATTPGSPAPSPSSDRWPRSPRRRGGSRRPRTCPARRRRGSGPPRWTPSPSPGCCARKSSPGRFRKIMMCPTSIPTIPRPTHIASRAVDLVEGSSQGVPEGQVHAPDPLRGHSAVDQSGRGGGGDSTDLTDKQSFSKASR